LAIRIAPISRQPERTVNGDLSTVESRPRTAGLLWPVLGLVAGLLIACTTSGLPESGLGTVVGVVDGDTLVVDLDGRSESIRLLGIDTPETVHPDRDPECFGAEASARLALLLAPGAAVAITRDVEARDRYGRLLAYVERLSDGLVVNLSLVENGFAATLHIDPNDGMRHELAAAEARARSAGLGLWSACGGPHEPLAG
jgi:micrococcal nuclease